MADFDIKNKKSGISNIEMNQTPSITETTLGKWTVQEEKAFVRKIDFRIFPVLVLLLILNFVDRNSFSNARLKGLETDLGLSDVQYQVCFEKFPNLEGI